MLAERNTEKGPGTALPRPYFVVVHLMLIVHPPVVCMYHAHGDLSEVVDRWNGCKE